MGFISPFVFFSKKMKTVPLGNMIHMSEQQNVGCTYVKALGIQNL
jgi:hypothetical protein